MSLRITKELPVNITDDIDINLLLDRLFPVQVPTIYTLTSRELNTFGMAATTLNGSDTRPDYDSTQKVYWSLKYILKLFEKGGASIALWGDTEEARQKSAIRMYETLQEILEIGSGKVQRSIHSKLLPNDMLMLVDKFSETMFGNVKATLVKDASHTPIDDIFGNSGFLSAGHSPVILPKQGSDKVVGSRFDKYGQNDFGNIPDIDPDKAYRISPLRR